MRIGVICEGPTDFLTIRSFLGEEFKKISSPVTFAIIQPALDNTLPGGWSQVLYWLENNPLTQRTAVYSKGDSLFLNENSADKFDALMFQIDTDIIGEKGFEKFIADRGITVFNPVSPTDRGDYIREILRTIAGHLTDEEERAANELSLAIVESCETWIIAALGEYEDPEGVRGQDLIDSFGKVLAEFNGQPAKTKYKKINKKVNTRAKFCDNVSQRGTPLGRAAQYDRVFAQLKHIQANLSA